VTLPFYGNGSGYVQRSAKGEGERRAKSNLTFTVGAKHVPWPNIFIRLRRAEQTILYKPTIDLEIQIYITGFLMTLR